MSRPQCPPFDEGFTLVELLISMTILMILFALTTTIISSFFSNQTRITATYNGFDQILPATTAMQRSFIDMVEPTPPAVVGGIYVPVPPLQYNAGSGYQVSPNSATFTTNVGDPNGPALIVVATTSNASPRAGSPQTYSVKATITDADRGTCPGVSTGTACTWLTNPVKTLFALTDVTNGSQTASDPIFQYTTAQSGGSPIPYSTLSGSAWSAAFGPNTCIAQSNCPADQITAVAVNFDIQPRGSASSVYHTIITPVSIPYAQNVG